MISINPKAPVNIRNSILINANSTEIWEVLTGIDKWPTWQSSIKKAKLDGALQPGSEFKWKSGGITIRSRLHTVQQYNNFGWSGKNLGLYAILNWTLIEQKKQTEVFVEETVEGFLAKLLSILLKKSVNKRNQKWLELLKIACESVEVEQDVSVEKPIS